MSGIMLNIAGGNFAPSVPTVIGQAFGGGFYAGQISTAGSGVADYYLIVGPIASTQSTLQYKTTNTPTAGTDSRINGPTNSANMNNASHPAAQFCEGLTVGGFTDWFMPSRNELEICYYNLKPTTTANTTGSATNDNAVPARTSNYTTGTPAQTSAADFQDTGAEDFAAADYWSSTEAAGGGGNYAWFQQFTNGNQDYNLAGKMASKRVRATRRIAV